MTFTEETDMKKSSDAFMKQKKALQAFQQKRLNQTHKNLKQMQEYEKIGRFFFDKLYSPDDFSFRDQSIKKLHKLLKGKVYKGMVSAVAMVIELHNLSDNLDDRMVDEMLAEGIGPDFNMDQYQEIYRSLDNYDERVDQIKLVGQVNRIFHRISKKWIVGVSLATVRKAAHLFGVGKILDFIHEGYEAFRAIDNIDYFIDVIEERELAWHAEIWSNDVRSLRN